MKWEQIESKWAVMTRRIRADYVADRIEPTGRPSRRVPVRDGFSATNLDGISAPANDPENKTSAK